MDHLMLVDRAHAVKEGFVPRLKNSGGILLEEHTAAACEEMLSAAGKSGIALKLLSGYRTREYQKGLFDRSVAEYMSQGLDRDEAWRMTARYIAVPGYSEHETGLAADFCTADADDTQDNFGNLSEGRWLAMNAHRFGFVLRYPRMKEHITGIAYEPWHFRFTGLPHSERMFSSGITLEEYLYYYGL